MKNIASFLKRMTTFSMALLMTGIICTALPKQTASAASVDYPPVLLRISTNDNSYNLNISGTADKSACVTAALQNSQNESWRFDYTGTDSNGSYYRIVNQASGRVLTPMGYSVTAETECVIFGNTNDKTQYWYVNPVDKDSYGNNLHYQILNYANKKLALTNGSQITLSTYSGSNAQKWLLNAVGLQGFGGYCKAMNGKEKACNLGGTLGKTVEVSTFDELKAACTNNETCTVVITKNISKTGTYSKDGNGRYRFTDAKIYVNPNKTIIGSYGAHSLYNVFFQTFGENYGPGHDIILRNIEISHDKELNSDNIWEFAYGSNYWIDHITFIGHDKVNGASTRTDDWDKFLNFKGNTDFITISDCNFGLHEYGVLLGYPTDDEATYKQYNGHPCVTLTANYYHDTLTRAPGLMRYGYFHSLNNYVNKFSMGYTVHTACDIYAENCVYENGGNVICDWNQITYAGAYAESGSIFSNCSRTKQGEGTKNNPSYSKPSNFRPAGNYSYTAMPTANVKGYVTKYSGAQSAATNMTHSAFSAAGYRSANFITAPDTTMEPETIEPMSGRLISDLVVNDSTRKSWSIDSDLQTGDFVFGDREVIWTALPAELIGSEAIVTACDAKNSTGDALAACKASADITVWIALDNRVETVPAWMNGFAKSNLTAQNDKDVMFDLYSKSVKAGETITLGANGQSSYCVNYTVIASLPKQDITGDGVTDLQDVIALRDYLLTTGTLKNPAAADRNGDGKINAIDLTLLKRELLTAPAVTTAPAETTVIATTTTTAAVSNSYESADFKFSGKVYLVGDSTVCDYDSNSNQTLDRYGWGQKIAGCYNNITVTNLALSGRSSRSFLTEKNYQTLKSSIGKGDYLFIQFGHNDEKTDESTYPGLGTYPNLDWKTLDSSGKDAQGRYSYEYILAAYYINLAKNAGAQPVLVTPISRRNPDGTPNYSGHTIYQNGMLTLGKNYNVPVIDMTALTTKLYNDLYTYGGANETAKLHCYTDAAHTTLDNTHLSGAGAQKLASMIAEQTKQLGLTVGNRKK
ncbi:MAG: RICIN domain-containing protein [Oscillospiraceae bacterium]|nr:RICIN domain-containing protein [Oscillospiraceae bacterium]